MNNPGMVFPCQVTVRAMGLNEDDFEALVVNILNQHCIITEGAVSSKPSRNQKYLSVNIKVQVESMEQLEAIYDDLTAEKKVLMRL